jgi:hypothetical protein
MTSETGGTERDVVVKTRGEARVEGAAGMAEIEEGERGGAVDDRVEEMGIG